jgi:hypothetical protein
MATKQETLGIDTVAVNRYKKGKRTCDKCIGFKGNGEPKRCDNTAKITILRETGIAEFYCGMHTKETWEEMLNE